MGTRLFLGVGILRNYRLTERLYADIDFREGGEVHGVLYLITPLISVLPDFSGSFVLDDKRKLLYTRRNWRYEDAVRRRITVMVGQQYDVDVTVPKDGVFANLNDDQIAAIKRMNRRKFTIMTGGPGTGKTYTIARAVKLIRDRELEIRLGLAAPTGKAAARMNEAMQQEAENLGLGEIAPATTIHTLLGSNYDGVTFKHDAAEPLKLDWLIVDEASMVPLPLMAKLLDALPEECRLTLVGDANQLASVEPGRVFGDLCAMKVVNDNDGKSELRESKRFPSDGEIAKLADSINNGNWQQALELLKNANKKKLHYKNLDDSRASADFMTKVDDHFTAFAKCKTAPEALNKLNDCRVLCAVRKGPFGCENLNEQVLSRLRNIDRGCPIPAMITRNNRTLGVNNGEVGIVIPDGGGAALGTDGMKLTMPGETPGESREIPLSLLPEREIAFATTVHKAQGSEFENVILVLPKVPEESPARSLLTRELFYTALTRTGKGEFFLYADDATIKLCCENRTKRCTGLAD